MTALRLGTLLLALAVCCAGFYSKKGDVVVIDSSRYLDTIEQSNFLWLLEIYREGCGYCQQLTPHWQSVAGKLRRVRNITYDYNPLCWDVPALCAPATRLT